MVRQEAYMSALIDCVYEGNTDTWTSWHVIYFTELERAGILQFKMQLGKCDRETFCKKMRPKKNRFPY